MGKTTRKTTEQFIAEAVAIHGDKYSYEMVDYKRSHEKVQIWCNKHNEYFWQRPAAHTSLRCGCKKCGAEAALRSSSEKKVSFDEFLVRARAVHGDKYSYFEDKYVLYTQETEIYCKKHSTTFIRTPSAHVARNGCCPLCTSEQEPSRGRRALTTDEFILRAEIVHGLGKYDYSQAEYVDTNTHVKILCKTHGEFLQLPRAHLYLKAGCPSCGGAVKLSTDEFIQKAIKVHGDKYDYTFVEYVNSTTKVKIVCKDCGNSFHQAPSGHASGDGCPSCAKTGFYKNKPGNLYILASDDMLKVGITNRNVALRVHKINMESPQKFSTVFYKEMDGSVASNVEKLLLSWLKENNTKQPTIKFDGYTECFYKGEITICDVINKLEEFVQQI